VCVCYSYAFTHAHTHTHTHTYKHTHTPKHAYGIRVENITPGRRKYLREQQQRQLLLFSTVSARAGLWIYTRARFRAFVPYLCYTVTAVRPRIVSGDRVWAWSSREIRLHGKRRKPKVAKVRSSDVRDRFSKNDHIDVDPNDGHVVRGRSKNSETPTTIVILLLGRTKCFTEREVLFVE